MTSSDQTEIIIRRTISEDIPKIVNLQKESFPYLARYGNIWNPDELESHLRFFPEGQSVADIHGEIVGSASSLYCSARPRVFRPHMERNNCKWYDDKS